MTDHHGWIAAVFFGGLCVLSFLWTLCAAPGFKAKGKHVLLTGGTTGLGLAVAKKYAKAGAKLSLVGRSMERLESARAAIQKIAGEDASVFLYVADITDVTQVELAVIAANEFHQQTTDHVVCAASASVLGDVLNQDLLNLKRNMDVNYFGTLNVLKSVLPAMVKHDVHGRFVIVDSATGLAPAIGQSSFVASQYALRGLADTLRNEMILYGISVSIFFPGKYRFNARAPAQLAPVATPTTPRPDTDGLVTDYSTFATEGPSMDYDAAAKDLVNGLRAGYYAITNSWSGLITRALGNGVAPRKNAGIELVFSPLLILCEFFYSRHQENQLKVPKLKKTPPMPAHV